MTLITHNSATVLTPASHFPSGCYSSSLSCLPYFDRILMCVSSVGFFH